MEIMKLKTQQQCFKTNNTFIRIIYSSDVSDRWQCELPISFYVTVSRRISTGAMQWGDMVGNGPPVRPSFKRYFSNIDTRCLDSFNLQNSIDYWTAKNNNES